MMRSRFETKGRGRWLACAVVVATLLAQSGAGDYDEYAVKGAFLVNFMRLVQWPAAVSPKPGAPVVVGVHGPGSVVRELERALGEVEVNGHPVAIREIAGPAGLAGCHLAYLASAEAADASWFGPARHHSVLTVGDAPGFAARGGVINFFLQENKLRFEINAAAADRSGLTISSRLLGLARIVEDRS